MRVAAAALIALCSLGASGSNRGADGWTQVDGEQHPDNARNNTIPTGKESRQQARVTHTRKNPGADSAHHVSHPAAGDPSDRDDARDRVESEAGVAPVLVDTHGRDADLSPSRRHCVGATAPPHDEPPALKGVVVPAPEIWDALAKEYCATTRNPSVEEFALYWAYDRLMDVVFGIAPPPAGTHLNLSHERDLKRVLWIAHIMGNYQANWLWHNGHAQATYGPPSHRSPTGALDIFGSGDPDYRKSASRLEKQIRLATNGTDPDVLRFNLNSVRGEPLMPWTSGAGLYTVPPLVGLGNFFLFSYTIGFQQSVMSLNKPNVDVPGWARVFYRPAKPQNATYGAGDLPFLALVRRRFQTVLDGDLGAEAQRRAQRGVDGTQPLDSLSSQFPVPYLAGTAVWNAPVTNVRDYSERQYKVLLREGVSMLQWAHANTLAGLAAYGTSDAVLGRRQVRAHSFNQAWTYAYLHTIPTGSGDASFPKFKFARS